MLPSVNSTQPLIGLERIQCLVYHVMLTLEDLLLFNAFNRIELASLSNSYNWVALEFLQGLVWAGGEIWV